MTSPVNPVLTGRDIGVAERATRALLDQLLDAARLPFPVWTVLFAIGSGPQSAGTLAQGQVEGRKVTPEEGRATVDAAVGAGLIGALAGTEPEADPLLSFTAHGESVYRPIREELDRISRELYGDLPPVDLEATHRTLTEVTRRANALLAATS
jgi:DNA-binding MarR family transcriptional regulator